MNLVKSKANIDVSNHPETVQDLMDIAELDYNPDIPNKTKDPRLAGSNTTTQETE